MHQPTITTPQISRRCATMLVALLAMMGFSNDLNAQQKSEQTLSVPTQQLLEISVESPQEARVGQSYEMTVSVRNASESTTLHDIDIEASTDGPLEIQSAQVEGNEGQSKSDSSQSQQSQSQDQNQTSQKQQNQGEQSESQQGQNDSGQNQNGQDQQTQNQNQDGSQSDQNQQQSKNNRWTIQQLEPGQTRQIVMKVVGDEQKKGSVCLSVVSYRQSVCIDTQFTKPKLNLIKDAPKEAPLCKVVHVTYTVENTGTGDLGPFVIEDSLSDGLQTESGDKKLKFEVGGLDAGETRKFEADVVAVKRGEFSSRAVARAEESDLEQQSKQTTTKVVGPELAIAIDGPNTAYMGRPIDYTVRMTNTGNMPIDNGTLVMTYPTQGEISLQGSFEPTDNKVSSGSGSNSEQQPQEAEPQQSQKQQNQSNGDQSQQSSQGNSGDGSGNQGSDQSQASQQKQNKTAQQQFEFNGLEPGQTMKCNFVLRGIDSDKVELKAKASFDCAVGGSEAKTTSVARTKTQIARLAALLMTVVDQRDPVRVGNEVVYTIKVKNQGNSPDKNVQVTASMPQKLKFKEASGTTSAQSEGQKVTFDKVDKIEPGEELQWKVRATGESSGNAKLSVMLNSDGLQQKVETQEPTQLFGQSSGQSDSQASSQQNQQSSSSESGSNESESSNSQASNQSN